MRKLLAVAALLLMPVAAWAAVEARDGVKIVNQGTNASPIKVMTSDTVYYNLKGTVDGAANVYVVNPPGGTIFSQVAVQNQFTRATITTDSSAAIPTIGYNNVACRLWATPVAAGDSARAYVFAVEIRPLATGTADSITTAKYYGVKPAAATSTAMDTIGTAGVVKIRNWRLTINQNDFAIENVAYAFPSEQVVIVNRWEWGADNQANATLPRAVWIPVHDATGQGLCSPYIQVRLRYLGALSKTPGTGILAPDVNVRLDVIAWR